MRKIFTLIIAFTSILSSSLFAQCNPEFTFTVNNNGVVDFNPVNVGAVQHSWHFGDGTLSTATSPSYLYSPGIYNVVHVVTSYSPNDSNTVQCIDSSVRWVTIAAQQPCNINAAYTFARDSIQTHKVYFTNLSTGGNANTITSWNFGDGISSYEQNPTHVYYASGAYTVCLTVMRDSSCTDTFCNTVQVQVPTAPCNLVVDFTSTVDSLLSNTINFTNLSTPLASTDSVVWYFGDGSMSYDINPSHTYTSVGTYIVYLMINKNTFDSNGVACMGYFNQTITIGTACNLSPNFLYFRDSTPTSPYVYSFYNTTTPLTNTDSSFWDFGDGTPVTINPNAPLTHTYASPGIYTVCLTVKKVQPGTINIICERQFCQTISIDTMQCNLQAYFGYSVDSLQRNKFSFTNYSAGISATDTIHWDFGDGSISNLANPQHIYSDTGYYLVCMIVKKTTLPGTTPCVREYCTTIQTFFGCDLIAKFNFYSDSINGGNPFIYHFENTSTPFSSIDTSIWNFGDGTEWSMNTNNSFTYTFARPGTYTVCLQVRNASIPGTVYYCEDRICRTIVIPNTDSVCNELQVNYRWTADSADNRKIRFINQSSPLTANTFANWSFGDGDSSMSANPVHIYAQPGTYTVCLNVRMANCSKDTCQTIIVLPSTTDSCHINPSFNTHLDSANRRKVYFINTTAAASSATNAVWSFGDGTAGTGWNPDHVYTMPGWYLVCLTVTTNNTCSRTHCDSVFVPGNVVSPVVCDTFQLSFGYRQDNYMPNKFFFFATGNAPLYNQQWTFNAINDTSSVTIYQSNPVYVFPDTGYYRVCVRGYFSTNCYREFCDYIRINSTNVPSQCIVNSYPNPAHDNVSFNIQLEVPGSINTVVVNMQGIVLMQDSQQGTTGNNLVTLNVNNLPIGFYSVKIMYNGRVCYTRFQKI